jgi:hypothetical protein
MAVLLREKAPEREGSGEEAEGGIAMPYLVEHSGDRISAGRLGGISEGRGANI